MEGGAKTQYIDYERNGRLFFPFHMANYGEFKLPEIMRKEGEDPCNIKTKSAKKELRRYQQFLVKYMDYNSPHRNILIYHGLGSGKTASAINIYNMLYNYTPGWNVFILIKASLRDTPWMVDLKEWISQEEFEFRMKNIIFIHYDSPFADRDFMDAIKGIDSSKKNLYIIEESHNFINNVYSNISSKKGKRAQVIYDYIIQDQQDNESTRVICLSGTPAINKPFELALLFNLLRPGIFPRSENQFNQLYVSEGVYKTIKKENKNMFQRRILGLVSAYVGATPDLFARKDFHYIDVKMSEYQADIYTHFEEVEEAMARRARARGLDDKGYKSMTRQSANFVFPNISQRITGEERPRPNKFRLSEREAEKLSEGRKIKENDQAKLMNTDKYHRALEIYVLGFDDHLAKMRKEDKEKGYTIHDDVKTFKDKYNKDFEKFADSKEKKSKLFEGMHQCSAKMLNIIFNIMISPGPVLLYSNYVLMEGLEIFKIYLKHFGFDHYKKTDKPHFRYAEFHGGIKDRKERTRGLDEFNKLENKHGKLVKIMMISPAGTEGLSLRNVRQVHIMEPYWHEVRITQMIGRAVRQCSHKDLPQNERVVDVFRYKSIRPSGKWTADEQIEDIARSKEGLVQSFLDSIKEASVDCALFKEHNKEDQVYKCFQFEEPSLFDPQIGPAFKRDVQDDMKIDNGSNSLRAQTIKIKVMKIKAVKLMSKKDERPKYSSAQEYWFYHESGTVYDYKLKYPIGKIGMDDTGNPMKLDKDTYVIDKLIDIPMIGLR